MDLAFDAVASFTRWVTKTGALRESFVLVDIGVQGGENPRWHLLGDHLTVHGFDAIREEVEKLSRQNAGQPNRHYHWIAAGSVDDERTFFFNSADPCSSSFYQQGTDRFRTDGSRVEQARQVQVRRLDTLLAEGVLPRVDFIKVDVEGFEKDVFLGATDLLCSVIGVETETNFNSSPTYPKGHFVTLSEMLLERRLIVFDLNFNRIPRLTYQQARERLALPSILDQASMGRPATLNVLFCRDIIAETDQPAMSANAGKPPTLDQIIKTIIVYELYGLADIALDTTVRFRDTLGTRFDVDEAIRLLANSNSSLQNSSGSPQYPHMPALLHDVSGRVLLRSLVSRVAQRLGIVG
jgi:FkbM family methyltransferase